MRKAIFFVALLLALSSGSFAQQQPSKEEISPEESNRMFVEKITPRLKLTKSQQDSLTMIYNQYTDDIRKYNADNSPKVITYLMKNRDQKVKILLRDTVKYNRYILILEGIKNRNAQLMNAPPQPKKEGQDQRP